MIPRRFAIALSGRSCRSWGAIAAALMISLCTPVIARAAIRPELGVFEEMVEDGYDMALAGRIASPEITARLFQKRWRQLRVLLDRDGGAAADFSREESALAELSRVAAGKPKPVELARAINATGEALDRFYDLYHPATPTALLHMDYLGRELVLDGMAAGFAGASRHLQALESRWESLRETIARSDGEKVAVMYDEALASLQNGVSAQRADSIISAANTGLELVDGMEDLFAVEDPGD